MSYIHFNDGRRPNTWCCDAEGCDASCPDTYWEIGPKTNAESKTSAEAAGWISVYAPQDERRDQHDTVLFCPPCAQKEVWLHRTKYAALHGYITPEDVVVDRTQGDGPVENCPTCAKEARRVAANAISGVRALKALLLNWEALPDFHQKSALGQCRKDLERLAELLAEHNVAGD